jgi:hypothetical protein
MNRRWIVLAGLILFLLALALAIGLERSRKGVEVVLTNQGSSPVRNVRVWFSGGSDIVSEVRAGAQERMRVRPRSESGLRLEFVDSQGGQHSEPINVYIEPGYGGRVTIEIDDDNKVSWHDEVSLPHSY